MPTAVSSGLFVSLATIQAPDGLINPDGTPSNGFTNLYVDIQCIDSVPSDAKIQATEAKDLQEIESKGFRHVLLAQHFADAPATPGDPNAQEGWSGLGYRAIVDGVVYDILGAENDSQRQMTRMELQLVTV